jgi:hypothetical protein
MRIQLNVTFCDVKYSTGLAADWSANAELLNFRPVSASSHFFAKKLFRKLFKVNIPYNIEYTLHIIWGDKLLWRKFKRPDSNLK